MPRNSRIYRQGLYVTLIPISRVWLLEPGRLFTVIPASSLALQYEIIDAKIITRTELRECGNPLVAGAGAGEVRRRPSRKKEAPHWRGFWIASGIGT